MVQFNSNSFIVTIDTGMNPAENWLTLHNTLIELIQAVDKDSLPDDIWVITDFINSLMPDLEQVKRMVS